MAYAVHEITSISQIPALVGSFATTQGWVVTNPSTDVFTLQRPNDLTALIFKISAAISGLFHDLTVSNDSDALIKATTRSPIMNPVQGAGSAASVSLPTKLHLIGRGDGNGKQPFIAVVIEFGYNLYRHLYIGMMEKVGTYSGGEIISAANQWPQAYSSSLVSRITDRYSSMPLFAWDRLWNSAGRPQVGGLRILSPQTPVSWRRFMVNGTTTDSSNRVHLFASLSRDITAFGGLYDGTGAAMALAGRSPYALASMTQACPIYITADQGGECRFRMVGYPAGVRVLNIEDIEPNTIFTVGNRQFFATPIFRKSAALSHTLAAGTPSGQGYAPDNGSAYMGYAYEME